MKYTDSSITYYGPHACPNCGVTICKAGLEWGGAAIDYPEGTIYPNTEWNLHICNPKVVVMKIRPDLPYNGELTVGMVFTIPIVRSGLKYTEPAVITKLDPLLDIVHIDILGTQTALTFKRFREIAVPLIPKPKELSYEPKYPIHNSRQL